MRLILGPGDRRAESAVTGGDPEEMNEMPPSDDPDTEGPVYDGSDLSPRESVEAIPNE